MASATPFVRGSNTLPDRKRTVRQARGLQIGSRTTLTFTLALLQAGCGAGWRAKPVQPGPLPARQQAQVWRDGRAYRWHSVVVTGDSVTGIPFTQSPQCDTCRVALPRASIDSMRLGNPTAGFWKSVGLGLGVAVVGALVICGFERSCQLGD